MSENNRLTFDSFFPFLSISAFIFGIVCLGIYYASFQFNIFQYIDVSELLPLVVKDALVFFFLAFPFGLIIYRSPVTEKTVLEERRNINSKSYQPWFIRNWSLIIGLGFTVETVLEMWIRKIDMIGGLLMIIVILMTLLLRKMPYIILRIFNKDTQVKSLGKLTLIGQFIVLLLFGAIFNGVRDVLAVRDPKVRDNVTIFLKDKMIESSTDHYFIGKTKSEVFFYDVNAKQVEVYPLAEISKIIYKLQ